MTVYPEHAKLQAIQEQSQAIGYFIDGGARQGLVLAEWERDFDSDHLSKNEVDFDDCTDWPGRCETPEHFPLVLVPHRKSIEAILAVYFEIDLERLEQEKRQMLDEHRATNKEARS